MKKIKRQKSFSKKYWPIVAHLDDLQEIVEIMQATCASVELSSDDYIFQSLEDAKEHFGSRPQYAFKISGTRPYSRIEYSRMETELHVSSGDKSAQLFHEVDEQLLKQQRRFSFLYSQWIWLISTGVGVISYFYGEKMGSPVSEVMSWSAISVSCWFAWVTFVRARRQSVLIFEKQSETLSFMERNKNAIGLAIVTSLISGAIGYGFAKLKDGAQTQVKIGIPQKAD